MVLINNVRYEIQVVLLFLNHELHTHGLVVAYSDEQPVRRVQHQERA